MVAHQFYCSSYRLELQIFTENEKEKMCIFNGDVANKGQETKKNKKKKGEIKKIYKHFYCYVNLSKSLS